jgi:hypothetical protein
LKSCKYHAPTVLNRLQTDRHWSKHEGREIKDYPLLRGPKIAPMFLRFLRDWPGIELEDMDEIRIPVDVNVLRATLCAGVLRGSYAGPAELPFADVRSIWHQATRGLTSAATGKPMIGLGNGWSAMESWPLLVHQPWQRSSFTLSARMSMRTGLCEWQPDDPG